MTEPTGTRESTEGWIERAAPRERSVWAPRITTGVLLFLSVAIYVFAFWPGLNNNDSNQTVYQAQVHFALDWWTPFGSLLLREWFGAGLPLSLAWLIEVVVFVLGTWWLLRHLLSAPWAAAGTLLVAAWPPTYGQIAEISRDGFFIGASMLAFALVAAAIRIGEPTRRRTIYLALAVASSAFAYLARQNGVVVVIGVVLAILGIVAAPRIAAMGRWRRWAAAIVVAGVTGIVAFGVNTAFNQVMGVRAVHPERVLYVYDLASISTQIDKDLFPTRLIEQQMPGWATPFVDQGTLDSKFDWVNVISLYPNNLAGTIDFANTEFARTEAAYLQPAWRHAIEHHPLEYLWGRARLTASILGLSHQPTNAFYGVAPPDNFGRPLAFSRGYDHAADYLGVFVGPTADIPLDYHWPYLLASIGFIWFLWRRRPGDRPLLVAIAIAQWMNIAVNFFVAPASSYTYAQLDVPLAMVLGLWSIAVARARPAADPQ